MQSFSIEETIRYGKQLGNELNSGDVVCLKGELGAGKTHFVKGVASFFGVKETQVKSPTFTLVNEYQGTIPIYHFDCYRLKNEQEALEIGTEEYFYGEGISIVEWPERIENLIPSSAIWITIYRAGETKREIIKKKQQCP